MFYSSWGESIFSCIDIWFGKYDYLYVFGVGYKERFDYWIFCFEMRLKC